jgi:COP9 signalosome complex subunit 4
MYTKTNVLAFCEKEKYVKIAELYLQEDETVDAENFINRASRVIHSVEADTNWALKLRYQVSYARILDAKRKFLDAALRYYEFSQAKPEVHIYIYNYESTRHVTFVTA